MMKIFKNPMDLIGPEKKQTMLDKHCEWFYKCISESKQEEIKNTLGLPNTKCIKRFLCANDTECKSLITKFGKRKDLDFGWERFSERKGDWNAYRYMQELEVKVCPYCNRNYISYDPRDCEGGVRRSPFDHFFPKSDYSYLACSLWNLVPCCDICNGQKRDKDSLDLIYPYTEEFGNRGCFGFRNIELSEPNLEAIAQKDAVYDIQIQSEETRIQASINAFNLNSLYSGEQNIVGELLHKLRRYGNCDDIKSRGGADYLRCLIDLPDPANPGSIYPNQKLKLDIIRQIYGEQYNQWLQPR
jgi:hypothetical protein